MRAICESCSKAQPLDWQRGDLCIHCGLAVREEARCFWCAKWTPLAKFCRKCGADVLEDPALYAPARMLKDAGTDRFTIPKLLREFDRDRIETFRAIYQTQAAIVAAHVSDLAFVETFLHHRVWSTELEDRLTGELPWPEGKELPLIHWPAERRLQAIAEGSPVPLTVALASIALYSAGDWKMQDSVASLAEDEDRRLGEEALLALTHWRAVQEAGLPKQMRYRAEELLRACHDRAQASVRLAGLFPEKYPVDAAMLGSENPDLRFAAALAAGNTDALRAKCLGDSTPEAERHAAYCRLASLSALDPQVADCLHLLEDDHLSEVLWLLMRNKRAYPLLTTVLLRLLAQKEDRRIRERAATLLSSDLSHETAVAVSNLNPADTDMATILLRSTMPPETFALVGARLIDGGVFRASLYGMDNAAKAGNMPDGFVPANYARADEQRRSELIRFAEAQLSERDCEPLQDFLIRLCFEERGGAQHSAWSSMYRLCLSRGHQTVCPFQLEAKAVNRIFGTMDRFLRVFADFLSGTEWRDDVIIFSPLERFLRYTDDDVYQHVCEAGAARDYIEAIATLIECEETRGSIGNDAFYPLIGIAAACPELRPGIEAKLNKLVQNPMFQSNADYAIRRIEQLTAGNQ
jgi:hypothetical protein